MVFWGATWFYNGFGRVRLLGLYNIGALMTRTGFRGILYL